MSAESKAIKRKLSEVEDPIGLSPRSNPARSNLCTRCAELRLEEALSVIKSPVVRNVKIADVGQYYRHQWVYGCGLCHMLSASRITVDELKGSPRDQEGTDELHVFNLGDDLPWISKNSDSIELRRKVSTLYLAVVPTRLSRFNNKVRSIYGERNGFAAVHRRDSPKSQLYAPQIVSPFFDLSIARHWIRYCQDHHKPPCSLEKNTIAELHLIDCHSLQVVPAPDGADYTALSYVWGGMATPNNPLKSTIFSALNGRRLPSPTPAVIDDAISVTTGLGFHYLWVDRYCIDQDDHSKHQQISQMDLIYQNAELTIVAAAGKGPQYGLPGINSRPRCGQQTYTVGHFDIISTMRHPHGVIKSSKWSSRGWTLQEATLSRRNLVFTDDQVYFECNAMNCHESISSNLDALHVEDKSHFREILQGGLFGRHAKQKYGHFDESLYRPVSNCVRYMGIVESYTARDLTYDTDSLNAFTGIMRRFETARGAVNQIWGVPFCRGRSEKETCESFLDGLAWAHEIKNSNDRCYPRRRPGFPSWSWAGWAGEIVYQRKLRSLKTLASALVETWTVQDEVFSVCLETDGGEQVTISDFIDQAKDLQTIPPWVIHIRAMPLPASAFSCDTSTNPPSLQVFQNRAHFDLSIGPWEVSQFCHSLLQHDRRRCIYLGHVECEGLILVLDAEDKFWSRVGLITVVEQSTWSFYTAWKESKMKPGDRWLKWPVTSSRNIGEEATSFRIK